VRYRENIPLAGMSVISLAILFVFGVSEAAMRANPIAGSPHTGVSVGKPEPKNIGQKYRDGSVEPSPEDGTMSRDGN
jgi:hypothetical protein